MTASIVAVLLTAVPAYAAPAAAGAGSDGELAGIADLPGDDNPRYRISYPDGDSVAVDSQAVQDAAASPGDRVRLSEGRLLVTADAQVAAAGVAHTIDIVRVAVPTQGGAAPTSSVQTVSSWVAYTSAYYQRETNGKLAALSVGAERTITTSGTCSLDELNADGNLRVWDEAAAAVEPGRTASSYESSAGRHLLVIFPRQCESVWGDTAGVANMGSLDYGGNVAIIDSAPIQRQTLVHEFGHNLGLDHANIYACTPLQLNWEGSSGCGVAPYADVYDPMGLVVDGDVTSPLLNAPHRDMVGGYPAGALVDVAQNATTQLTLQPAESNTGVLAVKIADTADVTYYLDLRNGVGTYEGGSFFSRASGCSATDVCPQDFGVRVTQRFTGSAQSFATASRQADGEGQSLVAGDWFSSSEGASCNVWVRVDKMPKDGNGRPLSATVTVATGNKTPACGSNPNAVHPWFQAKYAELGGPSGVLGVPVEPMKCQSSACWQSFEGGVLTSDGRQIVKLSTAYVTTWLANGGPDGALGLVAGPESCFGTYCVTPFSHGVVRWVPDQGVSVTLVHAWFESAWRAEGGVTGVIGSPVAPMQCQSSSCWQEFTGGVLTSDGRKIVRLSTAYVSTWLAWGGPNGDLGLVAGAETCHGTYCQSPFVGGVIVWVPNSGVFPVAQKWFYPAWMSRGGAAGVLGLPTDAMHCQSSACYQTFRNGTLTSSTSGVVALSSAYVATWLAGGGPDGALGLVAGAETCYGTWCEVPFQRGIMVWEPSKGVRALTGSDLTAWRASHPIQPANPGDTKNCSDFATQAQAQNWFNTYFPYYGDIAKLDGNNDGRACESLP